jgi:uncharacterized protein
MLSQKFLMFMLVYYAIFFILDLYFVFSLRKIVKEKNWSPIIYKSAYIAFFFFAIIGIFQVFTQVFNIIPPAFVLFFFILSNLWFLPKAIISPFLIFKDIILYIRKLIRNRTYYKNQLYDNIDKYNIFNKLDEQGFTNANSMAFSTPTGNKFDIDYNESIAMENTPEILEHIAPPTNNKPLSTRPFHRREFLQTTGLVMAGIPFGIVTNGYLDTTTNFKVHNVEIPIIGLPRELNNLKIVQISDLHTGSFVSPKPLKRMANIINDLNPDLVFATGDFVNFNAYEFDMAIESLHGIKSKYGNYGCLGNHDHYVPDSELDVLKDKIAEANIKLLINESTQILTKNSALQLAGTDNTGHKQNYADFNTTIKNCNPDEPIILLCHDPTNWDKSVKSSTKIDLMLSGHTHGGQFGIETSGNMIAPAQVAYKQFAGLYEFNNQYLYINRGIGTTGPPLRVGINPEITEIILKTA